jgi:hypothetical protein
METELVMRQVKISTLIWCVMRLIAKEQMVQLDRKALLAPQEQPAPQEQTEQLVQQERLAPQAHRDYKVPQVRMVQ